MSSADVYNEIKELKFSEYTKGKYAVVFFYPLDFTFVCPSEIIAHDHVLDVRRSRHVAQRVEKVVEQGGQRRGLVLGGEGGRAGGAARAQDHGGAARGREAGVG